MSDERNFTFDPHTAFDLDALPVTKLARILRELGERGDFARVLKHKQIALIEAHPIERQIAALRTIGEDPEALRLSEHTPNADEAIQAMLAAENQAPPPKKGGIRAAKDKGKRAAPEAEPAPPVEPQEPPAPTIIEAAAPVPLLADDLEHVAGLLAQLMAAGRRVLDRELIAQVVREQLAEQTQSHRALWND
jgi:hypothetical protein